MNYFFFLVFFLVFFFLAFFFLPALQPQVLHIFVPPAYCPFTTFILIGWDEQINHNFFEFGKFNAANSPWYFFEALSYAFAASVDFRPMKDE